MIVAVSVLLRYRAGRWDEARALLPALAGGSPACSIVQKQLELWQRAGNAAQREQLTTAIATLHCRQ